MMRKRIGSALLLLLVAASARLPGQSVRTFLDEWNDIREGPGFRLGPLKVVPSVRLLDVGYDSNVYYRADGENVLTDYTAMLSPEIKAYWLVGNSLILSVSENPEYLFLLKEKGLRAFTNSFSSGLRFLALRRLSLSAGYRVQRHVLRTTSELDRLIETTARGWQGGLSFETARGSSIGIRGSTEEYRHRDVAADEVSDPYARTLDRRETSAAFEFSYRVFSKSHFFLSVGGSRDEFRFPEAAWRDASSIRAMGGLRFPLFGRARGQVSLGWKRFTPESPERKAFSGLVSATDARFRFWRFGFNLGYTRDNYYSYLDSAYYFIEDRFRAGLSFYVTPFLRLDAGYQGGALDYPEPQVIWYQGELVPVPNRRDVQGTRSLGLVVRLTGTVGLGLSYNFYRRTSNAPGFDIRRGFVGASLTYDF
jgi:hypothetical protein